MNIIKLSLFITILFAEQQGFSLPSVLGATCTIMIGLLGYFLRDAYGRIIERIAEKGIRIEELKTKVEKNEEKINTLYLKMDGEMRTMDGKLGDLRLNIIEKLELIKDKVNEARK